MSFDVRVRRAAETDIRDAELWYEEQSPGLGAEFRAEVLSLLQRLSDYPLVYAELYR